MNQLIIGKTFTPTYDHVEDRIRLSINYQDIQNRVDFMITRAFVIDLFPVLEDYIDQYYQEILIDLDSELQEQKEQKKQENKKNQTSQITGLEKTNSEDLKFFTNREELLYKIDLHYDKKTKNTQIIFTGKENIKVKSVLNSEMFVRVIQIIKKSVPKVKWGFSYNF